MNIFMDVQIYFLVKPFITKTTLEKFFTVYFTMFYQDRSSTEAFSANLTNIRLFARVFWNFMLR